MTDLFILDKTNTPVPTPEEDLLEWGKWMETAKLSGRSIVGSDTLGVFHVRTEFSGCDHNWDGGTPVLFETRVTENGERRDLFLRRYETWSQAESGHAEICAQFREEK
jgi:hypothetical protein